MVLLSRGCLRRKNLTLLHILLSGCGVRTEAWVLVLLQGVAASCLWQRGRWALMEITFMPDQKGESLVATGKIFSYLGFMLA